MLQTVLQLCFVFQILYCLRFYKGDEKTRLFAWDIITPDDVPPELSGPPRDSMNESSYIAFLLIALFKTGFSAVVSALMVKLEHVFFGKKEIDTCVLD